MTGFVPALLRCLLLLLACTPLAAAELERHRVTVDGHELALWAKRAPAAREAILLVHGRTWSALPDFDLQVEGEDKSLMDGLVAAGYAVYAVDLRGYGGTPRDASGWLTPNRAADDVAAVIDWIAGAGDWDARPHLFGWSMGSTVSELAAERHPGRIASLTLFGYWHDLDERLPPDEPGLAAARAANTAAAAASDFITPGSISQRAIDAYVAAALAADPVRTDLKHYDHYNALDPATLAVATMVIYGEHDPIAPEDRQLKLYARIGSGYKRLVSIAGGDHAAFLETPREVFIAEVVSFLRSATAAAAH